MWLYFAIAVAGLIFLDMISRILRLAIIVAIGLMVLTANPTCFATITTWLR